MANVAVTAKTGVPGGVAGNPLSPLSTSDTYRIPNTGKTVINLRKTGSGSCDATIATPQTIDGLAVADRVVQVPATTGNVFLSGLNPAYYNVPGQNYLEMTFSEITGLSLEVIEPGL